MKVYAFDLMPWPYLDQPSYYPDTNAAYDPLRGQQIYADHLDLMVLYEEYGFDAICINAHHAHPVRLAEEVAMLDVMSGGRIISGFVRGVPQEYLALSIPLEQARERLEEAWDVVVKAWTTREPFEWRGKHFTYDRVCIWPRPLQQPHPPIVLPADSDGGLSLAARRHVPTGVAY